MNIFIDQKTCPKEGGFMKASYRWLLVGTIVISLVCGSVIAGDRTETFEFENVNSIDIKTVSGSVSILPGDEGLVIVVLENDLDDPEQLEAEVEVSRGRLFIEEDFVGRNVRGSTYWTIYVPESAELKSVDFSAASGGFALEEVNVNVIETDIASGSVEIHSVEAKEFDLSTASGTIEVEKCEVDMVDAESASGGVFARDVGAEKLELSTASGRVEIESCKADYVKASSASGKVELSSVTADEANLSTASGRIVVYDCDVKEWAEMSCASGDVRVDLANLPSDYLHASTASGDVLLDVPQFGDNFYMTLTKREDKGKIRCPFDYTDRETFRVRHGDRYRMERYLVQRGTGGPEIELSTFSGTIRIKTETKGGG
jgi:F0F1-type ATP synthase epsilon subunit